MNLMKIIYVGAMTIMKCLCEHPNNIVSRSPVLEGNKEEYMFSYGYQLCPSISLQNKKKYKVQTNAAKIVSLAFIISGYFPYRNV